MSTKTTFKRIALVAVAALGLGVLSVAPSTAAATNVTVTTANGTAGQLNARTDSTTAATVTINALLESAGDTVTVSFVEKSKPTGAVTNPVLQFIETTTPLGSATLVDTSTVQDGSTRSAAYVATESVAASTGVYSVSVTGTNKYVGAKFGIYLESTLSTSRKAGTYVYTAIVKSYSMGVTAPVITTHDVNIVVAATAAESEEPSAAYSTVYLGLGTTTTPAADASAIGFVATSSTSDKAANLRVNINNANNSTDVAIDTVTISISGPGLVYAGSAYSKSVKLIGVTSATYAIYADGNAGATTITVSLEKAALTVTKSMSFYAKAAKTITAANFNPVLAVGANSGSVAVSAVDANGTPWTGTAYIVASSATDALVAGSTTPVQCDAWNSTTGILCPVTALTVGTAKLKVIDAATVALATATSNEITVTVKGNIASSVKIAFDKASYAPNEKAVITVTPLDASGSALQGKTFSALLASGGITSTSAFASGSDTTTAVSITTSTYSSASSNLVAGSRTYVVYMPAASGDVTISATGGTDLPAAAQVKVSATATVVNASVDAATDAANEATDAANAATDAALAAADAADAATAAAQDASDAVAALSATVAKLVASLKAQITSLTNLVIKIQKKVRA
jgi:hypothetical protein